MSEENRNLIQQSKQNDRINHQLSKEKDQMQSEHNRVVLAKSRLESLCRELQRQNKIIKEESLLKIKEEEEKRREIANKFQGTLNEIMQLIQENQKRNTQLKEENADLAQKLKTLMGHYENWEKHTEKIIKQKDLETQLVKAKFAKTNLILNQEKEIFLKEKQQLIQMIADLQKRCADLSASEMKLRTELSVYTTKYEEFQGVLGKSNEMFAGFKRDMEKMSKQIKKLEKETAQWRSKWETSQKELIHLSQEVLHTVLIKIKIL
jgi:chromosome segregation ATPase